MSHYKLIDIGLNLTNRQFNHDREQVIKQAVSMGVETMIVTGTSLEQSQQAQQLALLYPGILYATAGIHPHDASSFCPQSIPSLAHLLKQTNVRAVGECGLDFNRNYSTPAEQLYCFEVQLELAVEFQLPVFLHQRDAHSDFMRLIKKYRSGLVDAVAHCFTGDQRELEAYLNEDLYIGITGWLCDERRGQALQQCVHLIPDNRLMIETDAPYLFPRDLKLGVDDLLTGKKKNKRKRNEPQYLPHILQRLAGYRDMGEAQLAQLTVQNSRRFFSIAE